MFTIISVESYFNEDRFQFIYKSKKRHKLSKVNLCLQKKLFTRSIIFWVIRNIFTSPNSLEFQKPQAKNHKTMNFCGFGLC